jgi:hypothetical protein
MSSIKEITSNILKALALKNRISTDEAEAKLKIIDLKIAQNADEANEEAVAKLKAEREMRDLFSLADNDWNSDLGKEVRAYFRDRTLDRLALSPIYTAAYAYVEIQPGIKRWVQRTMNDDGSYPELDVSVPTFSVTGKVIDPRVPFKHTDKTIFEQIIDPLRTFMNAAERQAFRRGKVKAARKSSADPENLGETFDKKVLVPILGSPKGTAKTLRDRCKEAGFTVASAADIRKTLAILKRQLGLGVN